MEVRRFICIVLGALWGASLGGCLLTDVIPEDPPEKLPEIEITSPVDGAVVNPTSPLLFEVLASQDAHEDGTLTLWANDEQLVHRTFGGYTSYSRHLQPIAYARPAATITFRARAADAHGFVAEDSVTVVLGDYYGVPPTLSLPGDKHLFLDGVGQGVELIVEDYDLDVGDEIYEYEVSADSTFVTDVVRTTGTRSYDFLPEFAARYFWRARVRGEYLVRSPWSGARSFLVYEGLAYTQDFLEFSSVHEVVYGPDCTFLLGESADQVAVMKLGRLFDPVWSTRLTSLSVTHPTDGELLPDGHFMVGGSRRMAYDQTRSRLWTLDGFGTLHWGLEIEQDWGLGAIRLAEDGHFIWGLREMSSTIPSIVKTDSTSTVIWEYGSDAACRSLHTRGDRSSTVFLLEGRTGYLLLGELDGEGSELWSKAYHPPVSSIRSSPILRPQPGGDLLLGMSVATQYQETIYLLLAQSGGAVVQHELVHLGYQFDTKLALGDIAPCPAGGWFLIGTVDPDRADSSLFVARIDEAFDVVWRRDIGGGFQAEGTAICIRPDRLVAFGSSGSPWTTTIALLLSWEGEFISPIGAGGGP